MERNRGDGIERYERDTERWREIDRLTKRWTGLTCMPIEINGCRFTKIDKLPAREGRREGRN